MDRLFLASSKLRRHKYDECIAICDEVLGKYPRDEAAWFLKTRALTKKDYLDDTDMEEEGIAEMLMDEDAMAKAPRPGTSLHRPSGGLGTASGRPGTGSLAAAMRPMSSSGRPLTGFTRPGTSTRNRGGTSLKQAFQGNRPGTSRPMSVAGRYVRLGTQSMLSGSAMFIDPERLNVRKWARKKPAMAKALCDFLLYSAHNPRKAMELAAECTKVAEFKDWWWKARLGKCYYQLGMLRDAERQFKSALKHQQMIVSYLELCKVYLRLDQPKTALDTYLKASERFHGDTSLVLGIARVHDQLNNIDLGVHYYRKVLSFDASNVEAIACLASHAFYADHPEIALRFFRRLVQMGVNNTEIWNNIGLCCFYSGQYDMTLNCFERALSLADDDNMADVWYNIGQLAVGIGDLNLAYQTFKIAVSLDPNHAESFNNLGLLELRKPRPSIEQAKAHFESAARINPGLFEAWYNAGLLAFKLGDCQESYEFAQKSLEAYPEHTDSKELLDQLKKHFTML